MKRISFLTFTFSFVFTAFFAAIANQSDLRAHQIIKKMGDIYRSCSSYQDSGLVQKIPSDPSDKFNIQKKFRTYFVRPDLFRFEWEEEIHSTQKTYFYAVCKNGEETYTFSSLSGKKRKENNLEQAISANTGVSSGGIRTVPFMLIKQERSSILNGLVNENLIGEESLDGVRCYVLKAEHEKSGKEIELWIGKNDLLLRKLIRKFSSEDYWEELHKNIKLDHNIPKEIFNFKLPVEKK